jgi:hypothetical protein
MFINSFCQKSRDFRKLPFMNSNSGDTVPLNRNQIFVGGFINVSISHCLSSLQRRTPPKLTYIIYLKIYIYQAVRKSFLDKSLSSANGSKSAIL